MVWADTAEVVEYLTTREHNSRKMESIEPPGKPFWFVTIGLGVIIEVNLILLEFKSRM